MQHCNQSHKDMSCGLGGNSPKVSSTLRWRESSQSENARNEGMWARDEWDIALESGALYRLFEEIHAGGLHRWFIDGSYD